MLAAPKRGHKRGPCFTANWFFWSAKMANPDTGYTVGKPCLYPAYTLLYPTFEFELFSEQCVLSVVGTGYVCTGLVWYG